MNVEGMKVAELKEELKRRGLPTHGLKAALAERLTAAVDAENDESAAPTKNDGDDELSAGDAPATTPAPMSEAPQSEDDDVDFLEDAPSGPTSGPPEPTPVPTVVTDAAPTASLEEEPEEEPDYEPEETPTPPPKRPREDPVADDDDAKRPKVTEEPADGAMAPGVENNNNNDNDDDDVSLPTRALRIDNFVRPFTFNQVRTMLAQFGAFDVDGVDTPVWMNQPVKTHAIVVYADDSSANECKAFLDATTVAGGDGAGAEGAVREFDGGGGDGAGGGEREAGGGGARREGSIGTREPTTREGRHSSAAT